MVIPPALLDSPPTAPNSNSPPDMASIDDRHIAQTPSHPPLQTGTRHPLHGRRSLLPGRNPRPPGLHSHTYVDQSSLLLPTPIDPSYDFVLSSSPLGVQVCGLGPRNWRLGFLFACVLVIRFPLSTVIILSLPSFVIMGRFSSVVALAASVTQVLGLCSHNTFLHPRAEGETVAVKTFGYTGEIACLIFPMSMSTSC